MGRIAVAYNDDQEIACLDFVQAGGEGTFDTGPERLHRSDVQAKRTNSVDDPRSFLEQILVATANKHSPDRISSH